MKITWNGITLSPGGLQSPVGLRVQPSKSVQSAHPIRGTHIEHYDRGGKRHIVSWTQVLLFASPGQAEQFALTHAETLPSGVADAALGSITLKAATLAAPQISDPQGSRVDVQYQLNGAALI